MQMALTLALLFCARGMNVVGVKLAQKNRVSTMIQSVIFITIYSAFQFMILLLIPPYHIFVPERRFYLYPLGFAIFYFLGNALLVKSLSFGPASIANTIVSFNTLAVIAYSMVVWHEPISVFKLIGLSLFIVGLLLYNKSSYSVGGERKKINPRWLLYVLCATLCNGIAVIFTKESMRQFVSYGKEYLIYYCLFATIIGIIVIAIGGRSQIKTFLCDRKFLLHSCTAGAAYNVSNIIFVSYINQFPAVIFMPSFSVIGMLAIITFSRIILKERVSKSALISSAVCLLAILFLNIQ